MAVKSFVAVSALLLAACSGGSRSSSPPATSAPTQTTSQHTTPSEVPTSRAPGEGSAPPSGYADSGYELWLNASVIPPDGADMAAVLVNRGGTETMFGIGARLDRWDGGAWVSHRWVSLCLDHWFCTGALEDVGGERVVRAIGIAARNGTPGPPERFRVDGLDPGWYRLTQATNETVVAAGVFEVREGAPRPAPLDDISVPSISVSPILVPSTGGEVRLMPLVPPASGAQSAGDAAVAGLSETAAVQRWGGGGWETVAGIVLDPARSTERVAKIPPLDPGDYRIMRSTLGGANFPGRFWVVAPADLGINVALADASSDQVVVHGTLRMVGGPAGALPHSVIGTLSLCAASVPQAWSVTVELLPLDFLARPLDELTSPSQSVAGPA